MMKFFADTANIEEILYCSTQGVDDGITTNPKILEATGNLSLGFEGACQLILDRFPNVPVSLETDLRGIDVGRLNEINPKEVRDVLLGQAYALSKLGKNVVIKIPICEGGLLAVAELSNKGMRTNITACMTPYQAIEASKYGTGYVSLFANRMLDSHILELAGSDLEIIAQGNEWKNIVSAKKEKHFEDAWKITLQEIAYVAESLEGKDVELIIGSIREPSDVYRIAMACPQVITLPTKIVRGLVGEGTDMNKLKNSQRSVSFEGINPGNGLYHPMTQYTLEEFEKAADSYRKPRL